MVHLVADARLEGFQAGGIEAGFESVSAECAQGDGDRAAEGAK